jgi:hypothetical protein
MKVALSTGVKLLTISAISAILKSLNAYTEAAFGM